MHRLSFENEARLEEKLIANKYILKIDFTREQFEELSKSFFNRLRNFISESKPKLGSYFYESKLIALTGGAS